MSIRSKTRFATRLSSILIVIFFAIVFAGDRLIPGDHAQVRIRKWTPTRVAEGTVFAGDQACAQCHQNYVRDQEKAPMARAMETVAEAGILRAHPKLTFREGPFSVTITRQGTQSIYSVTDGKDTISIPIGYVFGQGKAGQTYVFDYEGSTYEGRLSFFNDIAGLDITIGHSTAVPLSLKAAIGRKLARTEVLRCFSCHSTGAVKGRELHLDTLVPGIRCEACHGPGQAHIAAAKERKNSSGLIFNAASLSGDELTQDFCASCHRIEEDQRLLRSLEATNVRYQPYRVFQSKCYSDDLRISCTACHNPHEPVRQDAAYYDAKCVACHKTAVPRVLRDASGTSASAQEAATIRVCKIGKANCASCHMPKVNVPQAHFHFTDHYIRVVKANEVYPK